MNAGERSKRNAAIIRLWQRGQRTVAIAARYALSIGYVEQIIEQYQEEDRAQQQRCVVVSHEELLRRMGERGRRP